SPAGDRDAALVEPEPYRAGDVAGALVHERLQQLALGCEPEAVVDHLGVARHERVAQVEHLAVERDRFERPPRHVQDGADGRLVDTAGFHADETVLDEIHATDAVLTAETVEPRQPRHRRQALAVDHYRVAALEPTLQRHRAARR